MKIALFLIVFAFSSANAQLLSEAALRQAERESAAVRASELGLSAAQEEASRVTTDEFSLPVQANEALWRLFEARSNAVQSKLQLRENLSREVGNLLLAELDVELNERRLAIAEMTAAGERQKHAKGQISSLGLELAGADLDNARQALDFSERNAAELRGRVMRGSGLTSEDLNAELRRVRSTALPQLPPENRWRARAAANPAAPFLSASRAVAVAVRDLWVKEKDLSPQSEALAARYALRSAVLHLQELTISREEALRRAHAAASDAFAAVDQADAAETLASRQTEATRAQQRAGLLPRLALLQAQLREAERGRERVARRMQAFEALHGLQTAALTDLNDLNDQNSSNKPSDPQIDLSESEEQ